MTLLDHLLRAVRTRAGTSLVVIGLSGAALAVPQGKNIGDPTGRSGLFPLLATPPGNAFQQAPGLDYVPAAGSHTELQALLGLALFWDEQVSSDKTVSCATCHLPEFAGVDGRGSFLAPNSGFGSLGVLPQDSSENYVAGTPTSQQPQVTGVIAPTMLNAAFAERLFWDARAGPDFPMTHPSAVLFLVNSALEAQAVGPPVSSIEMAHAGLAWGTGALEAELGAARILALATLSTVPPPLQPFVQAGIDYNTAFDVVFNMAGSSFPGTLGVTRERFASAVATYERTLVTNQAPIDTRGLTAVTLPVTTPSERRGFDHLAASLCFNCHSDQAVFFGGIVPTLTGTGGFVDAMDAMLTDNRVHGPIGFPSPPGATGTGSGNFGVKTPSLRNVTLKPSMGHNGFFTSLTQLLAFYNRQLPGTNPTFGFISGSGAGGRLNANEMNDVIAFFDALTDPRLIPSAPGAQLPFPFWHPDLYAQRVPLGSNEPATHPGTPSAPGGIVPDIIVQVPLLGNNDPHFKVGLRDAPLNAAAVFGVSASPLPPPPIGGGLMLNPTGLVTAVVTTDANGFATLPFVSSGMVLTGTTFHCQWGVVDTNGAIAFSNVGSVTVQ